MREDEKGVFLERLTDRLKLSLLDAPSTVQVLDRDEKNEPQWLPVIAEPHHAVAKIPVTRRPRRCLLKIWTVVPSPSLNL
jgi:hypothetical protein